MSQSIKLVAALAIMAALSACATPQTDEVVYLEQPMAPIVAEPVFTKY